MLKRIEIEGYGPYVCGRTKTTGDILPPPLFSAVAGAPIYHDVDAIRAAAKSMRPIYAAVENILLNDQIGDCTCAAALKLQAIFDCAAGREWRMPTVEDAVWLYTQITRPPFNPQTGENDNGADLQTVLEFWKNHGVYSDGSGKIKAYYLVDGTNEGEVRAALEQNGNIYAGCDLPDAWTKITGTGFTWGVAGEPDPEAGHCTFWYGFNETGVFDGTWGMEGTVTWPAVAKYFAGPTGELFTVVPV